MFQRGVIFVSAFVILLGASAQAMTFDQFARMPLDDEASYVTLLVEGTAKSLREQGKNADADRAIALFKQKGKGGGVDQFAMNVKESYGVNMHNQINPNNRVKPLLVEDAMVKTMKNNGIEVSRDYLLTLYKNFKPSVMKKLQAAAAAEQNDTNYSSGDAPAPVRPVAPSGMVNGSNWFAPAAPTPAAPANQ